MTLGLTPRQSDLLKGTASFVADRVGDDSIWSVLHRDGHRLFPDELFAVEYPAPGDPVLAKRVATLLAPATVNLDRNEWGLDHGSWSVLCHLFPDANIPVLQLSLDTRKTPAEHYQFATVLGSLRDEGVLIMGSGNIVHNLREMIRRDEAYDWAVEIDQLVAQQIEAGNHTALIDYPRLHPKMLLAVPTVEHYLPLLYILALQESTDSVSFFNETVTLGSMSMRGVQIG